LGVVEDISRRKQAEAELQEYSERLQDMVEERTQALKAAQEQLLRRERLAVLGQLAGGVGHELRNPLGSIKNAAYFLNMVLQDPEPDVRETLAVLTEEVDNSVRIINSLLDFARAREPVRRKVELNRVLQRVLERAHAPENVQTTLQLDEALPPILADPDQLEQVFSNLILNAIQAMTLPSKLGTPDGGRLTIKTLAQSPSTSSGQSPSTSSGQSPSTSSGQSPSTSSGQSPSTSLSERSDERSGTSPDQGWASIVISDNGVGIPAADLDKLFEPLFTTKAKGIGLGLALVKTLVEAHGGQIEVQSQVGQGSSFVVRLPLGGRPAAQIAREQAI
jgi:signal transduction histidine kinase